MPQLITEQELHSICSEIQKNSSDYDPYIIQKKSLTTLKLVHVVIEPFECKEIFKSLQYNTSITRLDLDDNSIGDEGASTLAKSLQYNTSSTLTHEQLYW